MQMQAVKKWCKNLVSISKFSLFSVIILYDLDAFIVGELLFLLLFLFKYQAEYPFFWTFQHLAIRIDRTSTWYDWIILHGISIPSGRKRISPSPTYWYPFWACYKIPCVVGTLDNAAFYTPWSILRNWMGNAGQSPLWSESSCFHCPHVFLYVLL